MEPAILLANINRCRNFFRNDWTRPNKPICDDGSSSASNGWDYGTRRLISQHN